MKPIMMGGIGAGLQAMLREGAMAMAWVAGLIAVLPDGLMAMEKEPGL